MQSITIFVLAMVSGSLVEGGRTWLDLENCARKDVEICVIKCLNANIHDPVVRQTAKTCIEKQEKKAFATYDQCLLNKGASKNAFCTDRGNIDDDKEHAQNLANAVTTTDPSARRAYDCFNQCTDPIGQKCRDGCSDDLSIAMNDGGDKVKACYQEAGRNEHRGFAVCINQIKGHPKARNGSHH